MYKRQGDTCYAELANAPSELKFVRIRIRGIDTPEIKGKCEKERKLAKEAKRFLNKLIMESHLITLRNLNWGKYGGRIIAEGTPEKVSQVAKSYTGNFIKELLGPTSMKKTA